VKKHKIVLAKRTIFDYNRGSWKEAWEPCLPTEEWSTLWGLSPNGRKYQRKKRGKKT
jgi:hypothetical protein